MSLFFKIQSINYFGNWSIDYNPRGTRCMFSAYGGHNLVFNFSICNLSNYVSLSTQIIDLRLSTLLFWNFEYFPNIMSPFHWFIIKATAFTHSQMGKLSLKEKMIITIEILVSFVKNISKLSYFSFLCLKKHTIILFYT